MADRSLTRSMPPGEDIAGDVPNLHFYQLAYLLAVARSGGITRAADTVHVSQPALSQALAGLERRLGVDLLERAGRGRRLTAAGQAVARFAESVLEQAARLKQELAGVARGDGGILRVGMIDAASIYLLPAAIRVYRSTYPGVDLRIAVDTSEELLRRLRVGELDLVIVVNAAGEDDLDAVEVAREPMYWYAPASMEESPDTASWALYPPGSRTRRLIDRGLARLAIRPRVTLESANPEVLRQVVAMELGWSVLPPAVAEPRPGMALRRGDLVCERPIHAARRRTAPADARVAQFLLMVQAAPREETPEPPLTEPTIEGGAERRRSRR